MLQESVVGLVEPVERGDRAAAPAIAVGVGATAAWLDDHGAVAAGHPAVRVLQVSAPTPGLLVTLEVPLGEAVGFWHPGAGTGGALPADYEGVLRTSLLSSSPLGSLYDAAGRCLLGFALDEVVRPVGVRFGVSEERKTFVVHLELATSTGVRLALAGPGAHRRCVDALASWQAAPHAARAMAVPDHADAPVYSTWYAFAQDVSAEAVEEQAVAATEVGVRTVIVDDGWQRLARGRGYDGCGDWVPDEAKFPDLRAHVGRLHAMGLRVVVWIAPLYVGARSAAHAELGRLAPLARPGHAPVLDVRIPRVREHLTATCRRLVEDYDLDGLKVDFLEDADLYRGVPGPGDHDDVGEAMAAWLTDLRAALDRGGRRERLVEFREPYHSPAMSPFANVVRAGDCPGDTTRNRASVLDAGAVAGPRLVHSDMLMWDPCAPPSAASNQVFHSFFAVPQISVRLTGLPETHRAALATACAHWRRTREVVRGGEVTTGLPVRAYPFALARRGGRAVLAAYHPAVVTLRARGLHELLVLNGSGEDRVVLDLGEDRLEGTLEVRDATGAAVLATGGAWSGITAWAVPHGGAATFVR